MSTTASDDGAIFERAVARVRAGERAEVVASALLAELTPDERLWLLDGDGEFWSGMATMGAAYNAEPIVLGEIARIGLPGLRFSDGPRGVVMGRSTAFPVPMARGATWDPVLEERVGTAIGSEMRAQGGNLFAGVCINLPRHPAWGRVQETYSEDPLLLGEMGAALTRGVRRHGMAVAKHFALNSMENARFSVDVRVDESVMHEVYLPHFRRVVEEGVDGIMSAYNSVNGEWAGQNPELLTGVLRDRWGFEGFTISDFIFGLRDATGSLAAGLDVEAPLRQQRAAYLEEDLDSGLASWSDVDRACGRILATQLRFHAAPRDPAPGPEVVFCPAHRELAREAARSAVVLLKNDSVDGAPLLPLNRERLHSVAVLGRLADLTNTGDKGSSHVRTPHVVTPLEGLRAALPTAQVRASLDSADLSTAAQVASEADVAIVVVGYTYEDEGEYLGADGMNAPGVRDLFPPFPPGVDIDRMASQSGHVMGDADGGDRASLRLRDEDVALIRAVAAVNSRTVVVMVAAGAVITEEWRDAVPALVLGWYGGSEGGSGLADVLVGDVDATGRLPYSIPTCEDHLPPFDPHATSVEYDRWFGQRLLDRDGHAAAFPMGYGLSYTQFRIDDVRVGGLDEQGFDAQVVVTNSGVRRGRQVVQVYAVRDDVADCPARVLVGFATAWLDAGTARTLSVRCSVRPLQRWVGGGFAPAAGRVGIEAAAFSGDPDAARTTLDLV
ncbi:glycoside hydrolase family 3 protein [Cellulomonas soli]|uniref:Beta-glucosidase n=2 Tax=Cellulomonas soli TaxID=931535 RepID=A0A512PCZ4_9CELL|nr:glycoside hydrolase family 3 C-terminal domain-containing protein [Cellulomonas soli]GEP69080.1 beta-glucosidase [Cellulomonas soli]